MEKIRKVMIGIIAVASIIIIANGEFGLGAIGLIFFCVVIINENILKIYNIIEEFSKLSEMQTDCIKQMSQNQLGLAQTLEKRDKEIEKLKKEIKKLGKV